MLFKQIHLDGILSGDVTLAFRSWKKATVRRGTLLKTSIGLVEIVDICEISFNHLKEKLAIMAGFENVGELKKSLRIADGNLLFLWVFGITILIQG